MSRLVDSDHYVGNTLTNSFVEKDISYDKNTNLLTLKRYNNGTLTNDLSFSYLGNHRVGYNCDLNGNITNDVTENLQVSYNFLNLPTAISQNSEVKARYSYAADSTKLGVVDASGVGYDYRGSFKYIRNGSSIELESVASAGGRTYKTDSGYEVRYFITDHLGSVRAVVNADGEVVEQNDYMPYGTLHANSALQKTDNRYLYGGKELQTDFGVNYYDSFARFQRTDGAFNSIDPKAENYFHISPYAYCAGNPVNLVDLDGRKWIKSLSNGKRVPVYSDGKLTRYATEYDKRIVKELIKTPTGTKMFNHLVSSNLPIEITYGKTNRKGLYGENTINFNGDSVISSNIILYIDNNIEKASDNNISIMQAVAATLGHEIRHTQDENIRMLIQTRAQTNMPDYMEREEEIDANRISNNIINEYKNKTQDKTNMSGILSNLRNWVTGLFK